MALPYLSLCFLHFLIALHSSSAAAQPSPPISLPNCGNQCGNTIVPYPFGFEANCFHQGFELTCNESYNPPRLSIPTNYAHSRSIILLSGNKGNNNTSTVEDIQVTEISPNGNIRIPMTAQRTCFDSYEYNSRSSLTGTFYMELRGSPYLLSGSNSLFSLSCVSQLGYFQDESSNYVTGCVSQCGRPRNSLDDTSRTCNGVGCCRTPIPSGVDFYLPRTQAIITEPNGRRNCSNCGTKCSYVFVADSSWFHVNEAYMSSTEDFNVQVVLDWAIRDAQNCRDAKRNMTDYACRSANHDCYNSTNGRGYLCNCSIGYEGNPYIDNGCVGMVYYFILFWKFLCRIFDSLTNHR